ncbi:MAG: hypothetical protein U1E05_03375 [Patescibacteria group bacterium]|nr:hypothetical protein [Patescibacteria group bacterium]
MASMNVEDVSLWASSTISVLRQRVLGDGGEQPYRWCVLVLIAIGTAWPTVAVGDSLVFSTEEPITAAALCPDGTHLATAHSVSEPDNEVASGVIRLIALPSGKVVRQLAYPSVYPVICAVAFVPRKSLLVTGGYDGTVRFIDTKDWHETRRITLDEDIAGRLAASQDGRLLAVAGMNGIGVYDTTTGHCVFHFERGGEVAFSRDGNRFAARTAGGARVWETKTWSIIAHRDDVHFGLLAFSPVADSLCMLVREDNAETVQVWSFEDDATSERLSVPVEPPRSVGDNRALVGPRFSQDSDYFAGATPRTDGKNRLRIWRTQKGQVLLDMIMREGCGGVATLFAPDGSTMYTVGRIGVCRWLLAGEGDFQSRQGW